MIRIAGYVDVEDAAGDVERQRFAAGPWDIMAWERYAKRHGWPLPIEDAPRFHFTLVLAHSALHVAEGFDVWAPTVTDFGLDETPEASPSIPPTLQAASPG